jgi:hypothetical protein
VARDPDKQSGPFGVEVPFFVALGNGEYAWQQGDCISKQGQEPGEVGFVPTGSLELAPE